MTPDAPWSPRTSLMVYLDVVNVPLSNHSLVAALFCDDLNMEQSVALGVTPVTPNTESHIAFNRSIEVPVRFDARQQLTVRLYFCTVKDRALASMPMADKLSTISPGVIGETVVTIHDLLHDPGIHAADDDDSLLTGFVRPLKTVSGATVVGHGGSPIKVALSWRAMHCNTRVANLLFSASLFRGQFSCITRFIAPSIRLQVLRQVNGDDPSASAWDRLVHAPATRGLEPSWFVEDTCVDRLLPDAGDALRVKLWHVPTVAGRDRLIADGLLKRAQILKLIGDLDERARAEEAMLDRGSQGNVREVENQMQANLTAMLHNPGTLTAKLQSPVEETLDTAEVKLEIARINRTFALFEYLSAGMTLDVTVAVDLSKANGDQSDPKSLHFLDPKGADPSCYAGNMKAAVEMLEPYACRIFPLGFNGTLPKETASEGAFQLCRVRPSGVVDSWAQLSTCYQNVIPGVALGAGPSMAAPLVSRVVQSSVPFSSEKQTYSVLVIFTNSVPKDLSAFKASVQESSSHPVSVIVVGVLPRNFSPSSKHAFQPLARLAKSLRGRDGLDGRNNFQFVAALNESRQACRSMMAELEAQILAFTREIRTRPLAIAPLITRDALERLEARHGFRRRPTSDLVRRSMDKNALSPARSPSIGRHPSLGRQPSLARVSSLGRPPSLSRVPTEHDSESNLQASPSRIPSMDNGSESNGPISGRVGRAADDPSHRSGDSRTGPVTSATHSNTLSKPAGPTTADILKEKTDADILKEKEGEANAIRERYRMSTAKRTLNVKARTALRDAIQLKLVCDPYEWKGKASMVTDTTPEATSSVQFMSPHRRMRYATRGVRQKGAMPTTIFNKRFGRLPSAVPDDDDPVDLPGGDEPRQ